MAGIVKDRCIISQMEWLLPLHDNCTIMYIMHLYIWRVAPFSLNVTVLAAHLLCSSLTTVITGVSLLVVMAMGSNEISLLQSQCGCSPLQPTLEVSLNLENDPWLTPVCCFRFYIFWGGYYLNRLTHFNAQKAHQCSHTVQCSSSESPLFGPSFSSCLFKPPILNTQSALIGQLTHTPEPTDQLC